jgi:DNA-binding MarR family transcriptional regulator
VILRSLSGIDISFDEAAALLGSRAFPYVVRMDGVSGGFGDMPELTRAMREVVLATERYRVYEARHVLGVGVTELLTLGALAVEGPHTPGRIAARLQITTASTTELVDRLERADLVARIPHPRDRRKVLIELTALGREQSSLVQTPYAAALARCGAGLTPDQQETVLSFLRTAATEIRALITPET